MKTIYTVSTKNKPSRKTRTKLTNINNHNEPTTNRRTISIKTTDTRYLEV